MNNLHEKQDTLSLADVKRKMQAHFITYKRKMKSPSMKYKSRTQPHLIYHKRHINAAKDNTNQTHIIAAKGNTNQTHIIAAKGNTNPPNQRTMFLGAIFD
jgi:hypothetical protein